MNSHVAQLLTEFGADDIAFHACIAQILCEEAIGEGFHALPQLKLVPFPDVFLRFIIGQRSAAEGVMMGKKNRLREEWENFWIPER